MLLFAEALPPGTPTKELWITIIAFSFLIGLLDAFKES